MKKLVLAMACVLSLGLLASCKQGTQDVNLKNQAASENFTYYGSASFSAAKKSIIVDTSSTVGAKKFDAVSNTSMSYSDKQQLASISWNTSNYDKTESNYKTYTLVVPYVIDSDTTANANNLSDLSYGKFTIVIYKIGSKYYTDSANKDPTTNAATRAEVEFADSNRPDSEKFTIKSLGVLADDAANWEITNLTFTRSE